MRYRRERCFITHFQEEQKKKLRENILLMQRKRINRKDREDEEDQENGNYTYPKCGGKRRLQTRTAKKKPRKAHDTQSD